VADEVLKPYQTTTLRWLWPDVFRGQDTSVAKAKKAAGRQTSIPNHTGLSAG
jgi:hypothetical protein